MIFCLISQVVFTAVKCWRMVYYVAQYYINVLLLEVFIPSIFEIIQLMLLIVLLEEKPTKYQMSG